MKKNILLILLLGISLMLCGCTSNVDSADKMDNVVLSLLRNKTYETKGLSKHEISLIEDFITKEKIENKIINLNSLSAYSDLDYENHADSKGVYEENGIYYIRYSDIVFEEINDSGDSPEDYIYYATTIYYNGRILNISKDVIPVLYDDTANNSKYMYTYRGTATYNNAIVSYYNSLYDDSGMRIIFNLKSNKITSIDIEYDVSNSVYEIEDKTTTSSKTGNLLFIISIVIILTVALIFLIKKVILVRKI